MNVGNQSWKGGLQRIATVVAVFGLGCGGNGFSQSGNSIFFGDKTNLNPTTTTTTGGGAGNLGMVSSGDVVIKPNDPKELKASKELYREKVTELRKPLLELVAKYKEQLIKMRDGYQKAGNLDDLLAARKEIEAIDKTGAPAIDASKSEEVAATREIYHNAKATIETNVLGKIGQLNEAYIVSLDGLKTTLMREDRLDDAIIVMDLIKEIEAAPNATAVEIAKPVVSKPVLNARGSLTVSVQVDGKSEMLISGNEIWFDHRNGRAKPPGLHEGNFATRLNGDDWIPEWEGKVTRRFDAEIGLPTAGEVVISYHHKKGRGHARILELPTESNEYTAKIGLYDEDLKGRKFSASEFIEFELKW